MNRRSFFKVVTGFVAGIFAGSAKSKSICIPKSGPPGPTEIRDFGANSTGIDPNSEWAKQKYLTLDEIIKTEEALISDKLGCKDCYRECRHWDKCKAILEKQVFLMTHPAYIIHEDGNIEPIPYQEFYKTV